MSRSFASLCQMLSVWCFLVFTSPTGAQEVGNERYRSIQGTHFEVVGLDSASVSSVHQLGKKVTETCARYLVKLPESYHQLIFVALRPAESTEAKVNYVVRVGEAGFVRVDFRWGAQLDMETVCLGLTEALVKKYSYSNYGKLAPNKMKYWPVSALASQAYLSLRPAQMVNYLAEVRGTGLPEVDALLNLPYDEAVALGSGREGYWLLNCLKSEGHESRHIAPVIELSIAGLDGGSRLEQLIQPRGFESPAITLPAWWESRMQRVLSEDQELYESMDVSLAWLEQLVNFDAYQVEGQPFRNLRDLWTYREDPTLREILTARRELIQLRIARINPAYYNVARSLGVLFDRSLESQRMHEFIFALTTFLSDYEDIKRLHQETHEALGGQ